MGLFVDIIIALPIGIMYNIIIHKLSDIYNNNDNYNENIQKDLFFCFGGSILGFLLGKVVFDGDTNLNNRTIKYGFYFGSFLLLCYSVIYNWAILEDSSKFVIMLIMLLALLLIAYYSISNNDDNDDNDDNEYENEEIIIDKKKVRKQKKVKFEDEIKDIKIESSIINNNQEKAYGIGQNHLYQSI